MDNLAFARELAMALVGHFDIGHKETVGGLYRFEEATVETIAGVIQEYLSVDEGAPMKLYHHRTSGGAEYLCTSPVEGTNEGDLHTAVIRLDGVPEVIGPLTWRSK